MNLRELRQKLGGLANLTDDEITDAVARAEGIDPATDKNYSKLANDFKGYDRTWGEAVKDTALAGAQGVVGLGQMGVTLGGALIPGVRAYDNPVANALSNANQWLNDQKSVGEQNIIADSDRNAAIAEQQAAANGGGFWGQTGAGLSSRLGSYVRHPSLVVNDLAQNAATIIPGMGAARVGYGLARAGGLALRPAIEAATVTGVGANAAMQGADIASGAYQQAKKAYLDKNPEVPLSDPIVVTPEGSYQGSPERSLTATEYDKLSDAATQAGLNAAGISVASSMIPGGTVIERAMLPAAGRGLVGKLGRTRAALGEFTSEALEEGGGQWQNNEAVRKFDPSVSPAQGVGSAAAQGGFMGFAFGGAFGGHNADAAHTPADQTQGSPAEPIVQQRTQTGEINLMMPTAQRWGRDQASAAVGPQTPNGWTPPPDDGSGGGMPMMVAPDGTVMPWQSPEQLAAIDAARRQQAAAQSDSGQTPPPDDGSGGGGQPIVVTPDGVAMPWQSPEQMAAINQVRQRQADIDTNNQADTRAKTEQVAAEVAKDVKPGYLKKDGTLTATAKALLAPILNAPDPAQAIRTAHQRGGGPRDEFLDAMHAKLDPNGNDVFAWDDAQKAAPATNEAGFVPEPVEQVNAQLDAVRDGRKNAVIVGPEQAKEVGRQKGLARTTVSDPNTDEKAVVFTKTRAEGQRALARSLDVGLRQALGELMGAADPTRTSNPDPNDVVVQSIDPATGVSLNDELVAPERVAQAKTIPGAQTRVATPEQVVQERAKEEKRPALGNTKISKLIGMDTEASTPELRGEARYQLYRRWANGDDEAAGEAPFGPAAEHLLNTTDGLKGSPAQRFTEYTNTDEGKRFQERYEQELKAKETKRGQKLGKKFDAALREPTATLDITPDTGDTLSDEAALRQPQGDDPYEHLQTREGTTDEQRRVGRSALSRLVQATTQAFHRLRRDQATSGDTGPARRGVDTGERPGTMAGDAGSAARNASGVQSEEITQRVLGRRNAADGHVLGLRLADELYRNGHSMLVGQTVNDVHDLAALAQVYRNPQFETFRVIYTDATGKIVGEAGYTSRMPGVTVMPSGLENLVAGDKKRFGATSFYVMHNHPAGRALPSSDDIEFTQNLASQVPGFKNHVIIDHNEYSVIDKSGKSRLVSAPQLDGKDFTADPAVTHPLLGRAINTPMDEVSVAKGLQTPDGFATVVLADADGKVQLIADVPMSGLQDQTVGGKLRSAAMVRRATRASGAAGTRFVVVPNASMMGSVAHLIESGVVHDVVSPDGGSSRMAAPRDFDDDFERRAFKAGGRSVADNATVLDANPPMVRPLGAAAKIVGSVQAKISGKEVSGLLLKAMTLRQIVEQYSKKLPAIREWSDAIFERSAKGAAMASEADRVALRWSALKRADRDALAEVLLRASDASIELDNHDGKYLASLSPAQRTEHTALNTKLQAMSEQARQVRKEALAVLANQWGYTRDALISFVNHTINDPGVRAERVRQIHEEMGKARGDYFPLSRFGDRVVVARGAAKDGRDIVTFHESAASVDREVSRLKAAGVKPANITVTVKTEHNAKQRATTGFIGELHRMIDTANMESGEKETMHQTLQQLYLKSLPELSGAKHMIRRENIEGYSRDAMRVFADAVTRGARYASHLDFSPKIQAAQESAESQTRSAQSRQVAIVFGKKGGNTVVLVEPVGLGRFEAVDALSKDGYDVTWINTTADAARERLAEHLEGATDEQLDGYVGQVEKVASRTEDGVEDTRAAKAIYNHITDLQNRSNQDHSPLVDAMGQVGYTWYLGFTPAFWLMNMLQNPMVGMPHLGSKYGVAKSVAEWSKAASWFSRIRLDKLMTDRGSPFSVSWLEDKVRRGEIKDISTDELRMLKHLEDRQVLDFTQAVDLARVSKASSNARHKFFRLAAAGAHHTEVFNRVTMALAAYRLALKSGANVTHDDAVRRAENDVAATHFDYSSANKPEMMRGKMRWIFMFKQYQQHVMYWWANNIKQAIKGESPEDRRRAVKAALLMGTTQAVFAGAMGLPFVGVAQMLANAFGSMFGDDDDDPFDFERWVNDAATDITGDAKAGQIMTKGIFAALGMDISKRIGQADIVPFLNEGSARFERNRDDKWRAYLFDLLGPMGGMALNVANSVDYFEKGDMANGIASAGPKVVADAIHAYQLETQGLKNRQGDFLASAEAFGGGDVFMQAAGVTPTQVSSIKSDKGKIIDLANQIKDHRTRLMGQFDEAWVRQDSQGIGDALADIQTYNAKMASKYGKSPGLLRQTAITQQNLASSLRNRQMRAMILAHSGGIAETRQQLMLATMMSGLYNPIDMSPGAPGAPGSPGG